VAHAQQVVVTLARERIDASPGVGTDMTGSASYWYGPRWLRPPVSERVRRYAPTLGNIFLDWTDATG
jgi:hypothetical protein